MDEAPESVLAWRKRLGQAVWALKRTRYFSTIYDWLASYMFFLFYLGYIGLKSITNAAVAIIILAIAAIIIRYIYRMAAGYLAQSQLVSRFVASFKSYQTLLTTNNNSHNDVQNMNLEALSEEIKSIVNSSLTTFLVSRPMRVLRQIIKFTFWISLCVILISGIVALLDWIVPSINLKLESQPARDYVHPIVLASMMTFLLCMIDLKEVIKSAFFQALKTELGPDYPSDTSMRIPGSLSQRIDHAHFSQHLGFYLLFWIVGLLPFGISVFVWASAYLDDPWQAVPVMAATIGTLALAAVDLFIWRRDLRQTLTGTTIAVQITDEVLNQTTRPVSKLSPWRQFINSIETPRDPAFAAAAKLGAQLPRRMPEDKRRLALWRLWTLTLLYVVLCFGIALACWPVVGRWDGGVWVYVYAAVIGAIHLTLLLLFVRIYLPQVELLDYLKRNL